VDGLAESEKIKSGNLGFVITFIQRQGVPELTVPGISTSQREEYITGNAGSCRRLVSWWYDKSNVVGGPSLACGARRGAQVRHGRSLPFSAHAQNNPEAPPERPRSAWIVISKVMALWFFCKQASTADVRPHCGRQNAESMIIGKHGRKLLSSATISWLLMQVM
jgi:hypothetical protein